MFEDMARRYGCAALLFALSFVVVFAENGILDYVKIKRQIALKDVSINKLRQENAVLKGEIERMQNDDQYLEDIARKRFGFIREGEKVYRIEK
jgi:cell division protein FtsB